MKETWKQWKDSTKELKKPEVLAVVGLLMAAAIVLSVYTVQVSNSMKIGFSFLPKSICAYLFGPVIAAFMGAATDIIQFVIKPTGPYFPGWTFNAVLAGFIYGSLLYKKPLKVTRILIANALVSLVVNLLLGTLWVTLLYGVPFWSMIPARAIKQIIMLPVETILFYTVAKGLQKAGVYRLIKAK